jgi:hypothetical protein
MAFEFDENTTFDGHKGTSPEPKRRGGRRPKAADDPRPEPPGVNVDTAPGPTPAGPAEVVPKKPGLPRTGKFPLRPYRPKRHGKGKKWAASGKWIPRFIQAYARTGAIPQSAEFAGVSRGTIYNWRDRDPDFAEAMDDAYEWFTGELETSVLRSAFEGDDVVTWDKGKNDWVTIKRKSEILRMFVLKRHKPEYRENYKAEDKDGAQAAIQVLVNVLEEGKRLGVAATTGQPPALPSFDDFRTIDVTPAETPEEKVARLESELAAARAEVQGDST